MKTKARPSEKINVTLEDDANFKEMYVNVIKSVTGP